LAGAAKREGSVVVYGSIESDVFDVIRKIFEGQYGIRVDYFRASSNGTMDRVLTESRAGKPLYDVVLTNRSPMLILKKAGVFGNYVSPSYERYPVPTRDSDGVLSPSHRQVVVSVLYNTRLVKAEEAPKSLADLLEGPAPQCGAPVRRPRSVAFGPAGAGQGGGVRPGPRRLPADQGRRQVAHRADGRPQRAGPEAIPRSDRHPLLETLIR